MSNPEIRGEAAGKRPAPTCAEIIPAKGEKCGRPAKARTLGGAVCGIHERAIYLRGGEIRPL